MTNKEIQGILLTHYLFVIESMKGMGYDEMYNQARETCTNFGVCFCALYGFGEEIYNERWVLRQVVKNCGAIEWWGLIPHYADTKKEILSCLMIRVNILQKLLNETS